MQVVYFYSCNATIRGRGGEGLVAWGHNFSLFHTSLLHFPILQFLECSAVLEHVASILRSMRTPWLLLVTSSIY